MEISLRPAHPTPPMLPDVRPTADVAAAVRDPRPEVPLPVPPGTAASGIAASARIAEARPVEPVQATVRTLKPYGITMLPDEAAQRAAAERAREAAAAAKAEAGKAPSRESAPGPEPSVARVAAAAPQGRPEAPAGRTLDERPEPLSTSEASEPETARTDG